MLKIFSGLIIIFCSTYLGISYASGYNKAVHQISSMINALKILEFDISFLKLPLACTFERISKSTCGVVKKIFEESYMGLSERPCENAGELFKSSLKKYSEEIFFSQEVMLALEDFSDNLGGRDIECEVSNIKTTIVKLKFFEDEAREEAKTNVKMCRGLGVLSGIFIVIVLI